MNAIETKGISKYFEGVHAVEDLSVSFQKGKITGLIGPNGSGKSTCINILTGITPFNKGSFAVSHAEVAAISSPQAYQRGITRTFQEVRLFEQMTVLDNVVVVLTKKKVRTSFFETQNAAYLEKAEQVLKQVGLWEQRTKLAANLSYGQRKLLEVARVSAMANGFDIDSTVIFFDEPFAGLFPEMRNMLVTVIRELQQQGKTIVIVEHNVATIRDLCDYIIVLDSGRLLAQGDPHEVLVLPEVVEAYIGKNNI